MILYYRPIKVWPEGWQDQTRNEAPWSPFKAAWSDTIDILDRELRHLGASDATLQLDTNERNCRADGGLRQDAKVNYHGVILSFDSAKHGTLTYPCNAYDATRDPWRQNVRAIALGLESLRRVERYGIANRGQQYAGWAELPSGIALGAAAMTVEQAAAFISENSLEFGVSTCPCFTPAEILESPTKLRSAVRLASRLLHPDTGGDPEAFRKLTEARDLLVTA